MTPETTPIPKETAKILVQKSGNAKPHFAAGKKIEPLKNGNIRGKPNGERRQQNVPCDDPDPLKARKENRVERHKASDEVTSQKGYP